MAIRTKKYFRFSLVGLTTLWLFLITFDIRVLVSEHKVNPGDYYTVEGYGNLGESAQSTLICSYFNGRSVLKTVFWYSPNNTLGKDTCPFITTN